MEFTELEQLGAAADSVAERREGVLGGLGGAYEYTHRLYFDVRNGRRGAGGQRAGGASWRGWRCRESEARHPPPRWEP